MTKLSEILNVTALKEAVDKGYVKEQLHPTEPLAILNYTPKAQFANKWNDITMNCRGLIYNYLTEEVVARGMPKFFNLGQPGAPGFQSDDIVDVADKADGSLGVIYPLSNGTYAVATRGSFTSEQAIHATELLNTEKGRSAWVNGINPDQTVVVEIVYGANRIVVDYGGADELVMLGAVENATGRFWPVGSDWWPWRSAEFFGQMTIAEALSLPDRENAEGLVLTRVSDGAMVKVKQEDYLRLHRAIFGLSSRRIWELMVAGEDVDEFIAALPDEFQQWAKDKAMELELQVDVKIDWATTRYFDVIDDLCELHGGDDEWTKKDFALRVKDEEDAGLMFALLQRRDIEPAVLKQIKPEAGDTPVRYHGEDVA